MKAKQYVHILDPLRGIAALAVVLFHYSGSVLPSIIPNACTPWFARGDLGVHAFFVISGFVIPYSIERVGYKLKQYGWFMARRWARIAPAAYAAAVAMIVLNWLSIGYSGIPIRGAGYPGLAWNSILGNATFAVTLFHTDWYNFVFWTLAIEFQFYWIIGLLYPFVKGDRRWRQSIILSSLLLCTFVPGPGFFRFAPFFVLGLLVLLYQIREITKATFTVFLVATCALCFRSEGFGAGMVGVATAVVIMLYKGPIPKWLQWLGVISYSLYIIHVPVGILSEFLVKQVYPQPGDGGKVVLLFLYTGITLLASGVFYRWVEKPTHKLARTIGAKHWYPQTGNPANQQPG